MADKSANSTSQVAGIITVLVLVAGAVFIPQRPLSGSRPQAPEPFGEQAVGAEDVRARLWQDPLMAAARHRDAVVAAQGRDEHCPVELGGEGGTDVLHCHDLAVLQDAVKTLPHPPRLLIVSVPGSDYAEDVEQRRRTRYAVLSALALGRRPYGSAPSEPTSPYVPVHPASIGYVELPLSGRGTRPAMVLPYEWFEERPPGANTAASPSAQRERVLVLWMEERPWATTPLRYLSHLVESIAPGCERPRYPGVCDIAIVGPATSDALETMMRELRDPEIRAGSLYGARVYSYSASAFPGDWFRALASQLRERLGIEFLRTAPTDEDLATALVDELARRRVEHQRGHHLVLVSEWDSRYGQNFQGALTAAFCSGHPRRFDELRHWFRRVSGRAGTNCGDQVHRYSYLRGLDGLVPSVKGAMDASSRPDKDRPDAKDGARQNVDPAALERAAGDGQTDYVRRLADRIAGSEWAARDVDLAIGIVGTDVYDKLLILQALRPRFPGALFFTTDLDARLLHPRELPHTRNLIVASGYGLQLSERWQRDIPPFRDTYQTSAFHAVSLAINARPLAIEPADAPVNADVLTPRLFEIADGFAFDLSPRSHEQATDVALHPARSSFVPRLNVLWLVFALVAGGVLAYAGSIAVQRRVAAAAAWLRQWRRHRAAIALASSGLLLLAVLVGGGVLADGDGGEPLVFASGISIWPSELLRAAAVILAVGLIVKVWRGARAINRDLTHRFFPELDPAAAAAGPALRRLFRGPARWALFRHVFAPRIASRGVELVDVDALWKEYLYQSSPAARGIRLAPLVVAFCCLGFSMMGVIGQPNVPSRGEASFWIDRILMLGICVPAFSFLLLLVVDMIRLCDQFTRSLVVPARSDWSWRTRQRFACDSGIPEDSEAMYRWIDIRLVAEWTARLNRMTYYPFYVIVLILAARSRVFDRWHTPGGLLSIFVVSLAYTIASAIILHHAAERGRVVVIGRLTDELLRAKGDPVADKTAAGQIAVMLDEVRQIDEGAFAPLLQQPAIRAALLPLGTAAGPAILDYVARLF